MASTVTPTPDPAVVPASAPLSEAQRILYVFSAPSKTFTDIRRKASWFVPFVLLAIVSYAFVATVATKVGWDQVNDNQLRMRPKQAAQIENLPPDQRARQLGIMVTVTKGISYAFPVVQLIVLVIIALIMMATLNFGAGARAGFGQCLAVTVYASLPGLIKSGLAILFLLLGVGGVENFTFQNPIASNLSALPGIEAGTRLYALLAGFDIFSFWVLILAGLGFSIISGVKRSTTTAMVFGWYFLSVLLGVAFAG